MLLCGDLVPAQGQGCVGLPAMFSMVDNQHAGQQFDFMAKELECNCSWQEGRIHEYTSAVRKIVGHLSRLAELQNRSTLRLSQSPGKLNLYIGQSQGRLIDDYTWVASG